MVLTVSVLTGVVTAAVSMYFVFPVQSQSSRVGQGLSCEVAHGSLLYVQRQDIRAYQSGCCRGELSVVDGGLADNGCDEQHPFQEGSVHEDHRAVQSVGSSL